MLTRRLFLQSGAAATAVAQTTKPKRLAIITTVYRYLSHGQHMGDRFLVGYPFDGEWHKPNVQVVSLYVDQKPPGDLSAERAREFGFTVYPTIAETLRCGGNSLAVDAVLIIGEHGEYPRNAKGQILYPRFEFFDQCVKVFEKEGRAVPVFNDKHLSYSFEKAKAMVDASKRLRFPMMAGSSLPVTWRLPTLQLPLGCHIEEALMVGNGESDPMDFHALEAMQCMLERRGRGETGVRAVRMIEGDEVWKSPYSHELLTSALSRSDNPLGLSVDDGRPQDLTADNVLQKLAAKPEAYFIEYNDGLNATMLMLNGAVRDFTFAARVRGFKDPLATQFFLTPEPNVTYSACLMHRVEEMFETGVASYPVERTLLTSGMLESCLISSRERGQARVETPHLNVTYKPTAKSQFGQA